MTRCELATGLLAGYVAGELNSMERAIVAEHLAGCAACRDDLARERKLRDLMSDLPDAACPEELAAAIVAAVDAEPAPRRRERSRVNVWASTVAAASLLAAAVLLVVMLSRTGPPRNATTVAPPEPDAWTQAELDRAREEAQWALAFTASVIERVEKQTIVDVMRRLRQEAYSGFRERTSPTSPGGRG